jgi:hypothetical protein
MLPTHCKSSHHKSTTTPVVTRFYLYPRSRRKFVRLAEIQPCNRGYLMGCRTEGTIPVDPLIRAVPPAPALHT